MDFGGIDLDWCPCGKRTRSNADMYCSRECRDREASLPSPASIQLTPVFGFSTRASSHSHSYSHRKNSVLSIASSHSPHSSPRSHFAAESPSASDFFLGPPAADIMTPPPSPRGRSSHRQMLSVLSGPAKT